MAWTAAGNEAKVRRAKNPVASDFDSMLGAWELEDKGGEKEEMACGRVLAVGPLPCLMIYRRDHTCNRKTPKAEKSAGLDGHHLE